jgi:hypothetical protein
VPTIKRGSRARRIDLSPELAEYLLSGHLFCVDGPYSEDLAALWDDRRAELLASYKPPSWCDRPCWAEYCFDLVPQFGIRRGVAADDADFGFFVAETDAEPWREYLNRCGISR